jgi:glycosyltransferase involved in cell wall biosynthesis
VDVEGTPRERRRVLILTREYPPSIGPHSIRVAKLAKYLPEFGWRATVVTAPEDHAWAIDESLVADVQAVPVERISRLFTGVVHPRAGIPIEGSQPLPSFDDWRPPVRGRLARLLLPDSGLLWALPAAWRTRALSRGHDALFSTGPPFSTHLGGLLAARLSGLPLIVEYRDNWSMNPLYRRGRLVNALNRFLEGRVLRGAAGVAVISDEAKTEIERAFPNLRPTIAVAPNGFDPDDIAVPAARPATFTIAYIGSLHRRRDPTALFRALAAASRMRPDLAADLHLALAGNMPAWVGEEAVSAIGASRVSTHGLVSHRRALELAAGSAVLFSVSTSAEAGGTAMTSKLLEYLGLRRPILMLAPPGPGTRLVESTGAGVVAPPDDVTAITAAVLELYADWKTGHERVATPDVTERWSRRATARAIAELLDTAVGRAGQVSS